MANGADFISQLRKGVAALPPPPKEWFWTHCAEAISCIKFGIQAVDALGFNAPVALDGGNYF